MTREEKIKEAWEETGIVPVLTNCVMCDMGWSRFNMSIKQNPNYEFEKFHFCGLDWFRPKSLDGIDNNNGWIKIESEDDLPKDGSWAEYHVYARDGVFINNENIGIDSYWYMDDNKIKEWLDDYTHYQPIQKPKPPIY